MMDFVFQRARMTFHRLIQPVRCAVALLFVCAVASLLRAEPAAPVDPNEFLAGKRAVGRSFDRYGDVPLGAIIRTDERYYQMGIFQGPRGWPFWNLLSNPKTFQNPNLWTDKRPTYFMGQLVMPAGSSVTIKGRFPFARYFKFAAYKFENNTFIAIPGTALPGYEIVPDPGSTNPYVVGADRLAENRNFTIHLRADSPPANPADRATNTAYVGADGVMIMAALRIYVSDEGYDAAGWGPGGTATDEPLGLVCEGALADGTRLSQDQVVKEFGRAFESTPAAFTNDQWYQLVASAAKDPRQSPESAPALADSEFEVFYGMKYSVVGAFMTPEERANIKLQTDMEGGGDPSTTYMVNYLSRKFGPIYVFRAKMPTFPDTFAGAKTMPEGQVQYWSVVSLASAPSGALWDGLFDMMAPLDDDGYFTIVVCRAEDRPANATAENGIAWVDWGPGEGLSDERNRSDWGMLLLRYMVCDPNWEHSPAKAIKPGTVKGIMGPYFPRGYYTTKAEFEENGVNRAALRDR